MQGLNCILYKEGITADVWGDSHLDFVNTVKEQFISSMRSVITAAVKSKLQSINDIFADGDKPAIKEVSDGVGLDLKLFGEPQIVDRHVELYFEGAFAQRSTGHRFTDAWNVVEMRDSSDLVLPDFK